MTIYRKIISLFFASFVLVFTHQNTHAHICNIQKLSNGSQNIILLSDFHSTTNAEQERETIVQYAKACGGAIVVEDGSTPLGHDVKRQTDGSLYQWPLYPSKLTHYQKICSCPTTIFMLYSLAIKNGVAASNIEFRFDDYLTLQEIFKVIANKKESMLTVNDGSVYNAYYNRCLQYLKTNIEIPCAQLFEKLSKTNQTLYAALKTNMLQATDTDLAHANKVKADRNYKLTLITGNEAIEHLYNDYCNILLEMEMIHSIAQYSNYKTVFVCAGGAHIVKIAPVLLENGYNLMDQVGDPLPKVYDPNNLDVLSKETIDVKAGLAKLCSEQQSGLLAAPHALNSVWKNLISILSYFINLIM